MNKKYLILIILIISPVWTINQFAQESQSKLRFNGYVKNMPSVQLSKDLNDPVFNNLLHNRLNFAWFASNQFTFVLEARTRLFTGETLRRYPILVDFLEADPGYADLSKVWFSGEGYALHTIADRVYLDWKTDKWQIRFGRQRINWGINMVSNPNDLFNNYSFFDFDYEERPGSDALRIQYFPSGMSRIELAASPAEDTKQSVVAGLFGTNYKGYDFQTIAGYFKNRLAIGAGWAGNIRTSGFKGELTFFYDLEKTDNMARENLIAAISFDHLFQNGIYGFTEFLYNGGFNRRTAMVFDINQPLQADNIFISEYAVTMSLMYPFSPILSGSMALMYLPDAEAVFLSPSVNWSVMTNFDLQFVSQIFRGSSSSIFNEAGSALYIGLKWSF